MLNKIHKIHSFYTYNNKNYTIFQDSWLSENDIVENINTKQIHKIIECLYTDACGLQNPKDNWVRRGPYEPKKSAVICKPPIIDLNSLYEQRFSVSKTETKTFLEWFLILRKNTHLYFTD